MELGGTELMKQTGGVWGEAGGSSPSGSVLYATVGGGVKQPKADRQTSSPTTHNVGAALRILGIWSFVVGSTVSRKQISSTLWLTV